MWAAVQAVITFLSGLFGKELASSAARYVAMRAILIALMVTVLPTVLNNVFYHILGDLLAVAQTQQSSLGASVASSYRWSITGLAGWFITQLKIPELMSITISTIACKFSLGLIPFVRI